MAAVVFDGVKFKAKYTEFADVPVARIAEFFEEATLYLSNTDRVIRDEARRELLLFMLTAHLASLYGTTAVDGLPKEPGRITDATEGSVSITYESNFLPGTASWFAQTQYGASFWRATSAIRGFRYIARPTTY